MIKRQFLILSVLLIMTSCSWGLLDFDDYVDSDSDSTSGQFLLSYNGNGAESGTVPSSESYDAGTVITIAGNTGSLVKLGYEFAGWNTDADGEGGTYYEGCTLIKGVTDETLYAQWEEAE